VLGILEVEPPVIRTRGKERKRNSRARTYGSQIFVGVDQGNEFLFKDLCGHSRIDCLILNTLLRSRTALLVPHIASKLRFESNGAISPCLQYGPTSSHRGADRRRSIVALTTPLPCRWTAEHRGAACRVNDAQTQDRGHLQTDVHQLASSGTSPLHSAEGNIYRASLLLHQFTRGCMASTHRSGSGAIAAADRKLASSSNTDLTSSNQSHGTPTHYQGNEVFTISAERDSRELLLCSTTIDGSPQFSVVSEHRNSRCLLSHRERGAHTSAPCPLQPIALAFA
jgi:hypothetical protein